MATAPQRQFNGEDRIPRTVKPLPVAESSWWIGAPPQQFTATAIKELPRMQHSTFARPGSTGMRTE
jgi:hypothetical protein